MSKKVVIIGGVAGGASVAARIRRLDEHAKIVMFERGPDVSFSNCSLPFFLSGVVKKADDLVLMSTDKFLHSYNIEAKTLSEVIKIDSDKKVVIVKDLKLGRTYEESYDTLFLSPGAKPIMPKQISGIDLGHVFSVRNVLDIKSIDAYIHEHKVSSVCVVGGGYIGLEMMENLKMRGLDVTVVEASNQVMKTMDYDMVQILHHEIVSQGVKLILNDSVVSIDQSHVHTKKQSIQADLVIMAIGVMPEVNLAKDSGITIGETGSISVDESYRTNIKDIYAVGDAIEVHHEILDKTMRLTLAGPAQRQARRAADDLYGKKQPSKGFIGSSSVQIFSMHVASTGLNSEQCETLHTPYDSVYIIPSDKVSIMPDAKPIHLKLIFDTTNGRILGCEGIGRGDVVKRIDVCAAMITMKATIYDLKDLELCYSPMYSTARDPLNHAALVAINILEGAFKQVHVKDVRNLIETKQVIIDVREPHEYKAGHMLGSINIPMSAFRQRLDEIPKDVNVYLHCRSGQRSYNVIRALQHLGYDNLYNISGSFLGVSYYEYYNDVTLNREKIVTEYNFK